MEEPMEDSKHRIITTHVGSLPRPEDMIALLRRRETGGTYDRGEFERRARQSIFDVVHKQVETGIDVVNDGEHSKAGFSSYVRTRLGGLEPDPQPRARGPVVSKDTLAFPGSYQDLQHMYAARAARLKRPPAPNNSPLVCTGPMKYIGQQDVQFDIKTLKEAMTENPALEGFVTALSPTNIEGYFENRYYKSQEEYLFAIADAIGEEYRTITDAGFILQIDDPGLITQYDRNPSITLAENRQFIAQHVEALNHSIRGIPPEKIRFHTCYSTNIAPRVNDLELKQYVDQMLMINAGAYSFEASNPRHEHEWKVWETTKLPEGKVLIPGVVTHCSYLVEHPEAVAQQIQRFASAVGRERVIASNDCGFATSAAGDEVHPEIAWAKMTSLVEGARIATKALWQGD
jgi:5-methyltetrahydropteroyltriglutamate--homocysteine methyltransferase